MNKILILIAVLALTACAPSGMLMKQSLNISNGSNKREVINALGTPGNRQFNGRMEAWQYCEGDYSGMEGDDMMIVWFNDSIVSGISTYKNYRPGLSCDVGFTRINWQSRPDFTLEVRNR